MPRLAKWDFVAFIEPVGAQVGGKNPVVGISQRRVGVVQKSLERGLRRLQNDQVFDSSTDSEFFTGAFHLRGAFFIPGAGEGETMRPAPAYRDPIPVFLRRENVYLGRPAHCR